MRCLVPLKNYSERRKGKVNRVANYVEHIVAPTPQTEALPGQVKNSAGGFSYTVDCWARLDRFLILGSEGGTYYIKEKELTKEDVEKLQDLFETLTQNAI